MILSGILIYNLGIIHTYIVRIKKKIKIIFARRVKSDLLKFIQNNINTM